MVSAKLPFLPVLKLIETLSLCPPAKVGLNVTAPVTLCPPPRLIGKLRPLSVNPEPERVAPDMVNLDPPEFAKTMDCVWLVPTGTFPKLILEGLTVSCGGVPRAAIFAVKTMRKERSKQRGKRIPLRFKLKSFTTRPLGPR
jgi:hypothetical protein